ncbi:purine-nucleoside phosphorylase [Desulfoplanes formicivorans]|uniref:Purine nucleoside phosphorylase n=1 Tax=Desulfoplanes formicivorans TaxID=1592317 RepID=A0A194AJA2_9BACT|nr:purine-nucleoside phosphorylase [Desulfoplanes formicivorans]GAU09136.1 purine nucleoside phosphorylase [Desulfoplanes formicivorans]
MQKSKKVQTAVNHIQKRFAPGYSPVLGITLGSGLGSFVDMFSSALWLDFEDIPGFPRSTVKGHTGRLGIVRHGQTDCLVLQGRNHLYEGYSPDEVCFATRVLAGLGVNTIILTNAAGALNPLFEVRGIMLITDHVNLMGTNPLVGANVDAWGPRFPDMTEVYCPVLRDKVLDVALDVGVRLEQGVYVGVHGPCLETPAETRAYRLLGGDAIGMSTVMEAIAAHHMGVKVIGLSCLTNKNLPDCMAQTSHDAILEQANRTANNLTNVLQAIIVSGMFAS